MSAAIEQQKGGDEKPDKSKQSRRSFLGSLARHATGAGIFAIVARRFGHSSQIQQQKVLATIKISQNPSLNQAGGFVLLKGTAEGTVFITRTGDSQYSALSDICPHKGCHVEVKSKTLIRCPCHHSTYKIDGTYISGPAHASLRKFQISQQGDMLTVLDADAND